MSAHSNTWHVYPENDLKPHDLYGYNCECQPEVKYDSADEFVMVIHNAFDKREKLEAYNLGKINSN